VSYENFIFMAPLYPFLFYKYLFLPHHPPHIPPFLSLSLIEHENGSRSTIDSQESVQHATFNLLDDAKGYVKEQAHA
jgi:hypothetical protein